jgi:hypothetical protein
MEMVCPFQMYIGFQRIVRHHSSEDVTLSCKYGSQILNKNVSASVEVRVYLLPLEASS